MAANKECLIIVIDIRESANMEFKEKSVKCAADILKDKIVSAKKDYVGFVLVGTENTNNDPNSNINHECYLNIVEYPHVQLATWQLLLNLYKFVNEPVAEKGGEWLDGLIVAMNMIKNAQNTFKFERQRILLFFDFNDQQHDFDDFESISDGLSAMNIELIAVSHNIAYIDNPAIKQPQAIFKRHAKVELTKQRLQNEKYILQLVANAGAKLCNFDEALSTVFKITNKQPWCWSQPFTIGSQIKIYISGIIAIKDESKIKLKKVWTDGQDTVSRVKAYFDNNVEINPTEDELMDGYMLGSTPIPFDEVQEIDDTALEAGLQFIGFPKRTDIPDEYFTGDALYWITHQKGRESSAKKLHALVKALHNTGRVVLCWKIFSKVHNTPKLVVLLPNKLLPKQPATLSMIELAFYTQHLFWDFPRLSTDKTECSQQQLNAIDNLIDAMDLNISSKLSEEPRRSYTSDLLPYDKLPHIYEQNLMDVLERKILTNADEDDEIFQEMLKDKNFVEAFWKLPEEVEQQAKQACKEVKRLFPLEVNQFYAQKEAAKNKANANKNGATAAASSSSTAQSSSSDSSIAKIGWQSPGEDFEQLLKRHVLTLQNNTERDAKFQELSKQLRAAVWHMLFDMPQNFKAAEIVDALKIYRKSCLDFNSFEDYNKWLRQVKAAVLETGLHKFWKDYIVKEQLGLCVVGEASLPEKVELSEFYDIAEEP